MNVCFATVSIESGTVAMEFSDTGPGIAEAVRQLVFEPFVTTKRHGTGLGLALCRAITDVHRGTIRAENRTPGPGAVFTVEFPAEAASGARPAAPVPAR